MDKILFVDDEPNVTAALQRTFRRHFDVTIANNAVEALGYLLDGRHFAVVISDLNMPAVSGVQLLKEFQKRSPDTIRIVLTGAANVSVALAAVEAGEIHRYLSKPCSSDKLQLCIDEALGEYRRVKTARRPQLGQAKGGQLEQAAIAKRLVDLKEGDVLAENVRNAQGHLLLSKGQLLTSLSIANLRKAAAQAPIEGPIRVQRK